MKVHDIKLMGKKGFFADYWFGEKIVNRKEAGAVGKESWKVTVNKVEARRPPATDDASADSSSRSTT